ncbi:plakophilin-3-like isoform X1 [Poeciliopsis prolifica]|uniref:plakophilin-3-like isoform X1 n=1 Tax=Poeciliopsis prolifica TaxID=188132 RepID=UPI002413668E|nr:plakophilin-3-like isoform X1 [Poeciliopsis prolifica]
MSTMTSENAFLSSLQPHTLSTTYALPSDNQLGNGSAMSDDAVRARRVQEQIKLKLAEKGTLPRQNGKASQYAMSDYGGSSTMKYSHYSPSYSPKTSSMYSKTLGPRVTTRAEFSSRSAAPDFTQFQRMSVGGGGGGGFYREEMYRGGVQGSIRQNQMDRDDMSVHSMRNMQTANPWMMDNSDAGSLISERDGTFDHQYSQNGYSTQIRQGGGIITQQTGFQTQEPAMSFGRQSLSGTLSRGGGLGGGGSEIIQQQSFRGPAHRTISRITNRNRMSVGSLSGSRMTASAGNIGAGGDRMDGGFLMSVKAGSQRNLAQQRLGGMSRSTSMRSVHSVGGGMDIYGQADFEELPHLQSINSMDMPTAVSYLREDEKSMQVLGSAYIQHKCYNDKSAKEEVNKLGAIQFLVDMLNSNDPEVRRYSSGAVRNLIFEHNDNKNNFVHHNGISEIHKALDIDDDELRKNITGILWNLSARDHLKEKLKDLIPKLATQILIPLSEDESKKAQNIKENLDIPSDCPSKREILNNTLGLLRNLSSGSDKVRTEMRTTKGLVESLVDVVMTTIDTGKIQNKDAENTVCILRNLSFQVYDEMPPSLKANWTSGQTTSSETVGCFSPNSSKLKRKQCAEKSFSPAELTKNPSGMEWLWHPKIVHLYFSVIKSCEINSTTREAALGALQNITAGQERWAEKISGYIVNDCKMVPSLMDLMQSERISELRVLSGLMRNISNHADIGQAVDVVVKKLPESSNSSKLPPEVVINLCGVLNNMVARSFNSAKRITENSGLQKLMSMKEFAAITPDMADVSRSAGIVLRNMYNYRKLHSVFRKQNYKKSDFIPRS